MNSADYCKRSGGRFLSRCVHTEQSYLLVMNYKNPLDYPPTLWHHCSIETTDGELK